MWQSCYVIVKGLSATSRERVPEVALVGISSARLRGNADLGRTPPLRRKNLITAQIRENICHSVYFKTLADMK
jgi:hypothetical protein